MIIKGNLIEAICWLLQTDGRESLSEKVTFETSPEQPLRTGHMKTGEKHSEWEGYVAGNNPKVETYLL